MSETLHEELISDKEVTTAIKKTKRKKQTKVTKAEAKRKVTMEAKKKEWAEIEELVTIYKQIFDEEELNRVDKQKCTAASKELLKRFEPLIKKYLNIFKGNQLDFTDSSVRIFCMTFMSEPQLKYALKRSTTAIRYRTEINSRFQFVRDNYGSRSSEEIRAELQLLLLNLARRYKPMGRNFCGYVANVYMFEVVRFVQKFLREVNNIAFKNVEYDEYMTSENERGYETIYEDKYYENSLGIPDISWISGLHCSDEFKALDNLERKILIKYYLEDYNDKQIAEMFGLHHNTVNQKRKHALKLIATELKIPFDQIKRSRKSGLKAGLK